MSSGRYSLLILVDRLIRLSVSLVPIHTHAHLLLRTFRFVRSGARDNQIETNQTNRNNFTFIRTQAGPTTTRSKLTRTWRCSTLSCRRHQAPGHRSVIESLNLSPVHDPPVVPRLEVGLEDQIQQDHGSITRSRHVSRADRHVPHVSDPLFNLIGLHILRPVRGRICRRLRTSTLAARWAVSHRRSLWCRR